MFIFQMISFCAFDYNSDHFRETQAVFQPIGSSPNNMNTVKIGLLTYSSCPGGRTALHRSLRSLRLCQAPVDERKVSVQRIWATG